MPTPECYQEIGELRAQVDQLLEQQRINSNRITALEMDKVKVATFGGILAFCLTGIGVIFADPIKSFGARLIH